jgi:carbonic anhydrase/acetyltransferase-like protein (isoleucine patch superfamily)
MNKKFTPSRLIKRVYLKIWRIMVVFTAFFAMDAAQGVDTWCLPLTGPAPCDGQPGRCITNPDGSQGGFVAHTANVQITPEGLGVGHFRIGIAASVCDSASVSDHAILSDSAKVGGSAHISGNARIRENATIGQWATVSELAEVAGNARVLGNAEILGNAQVSGTTIVYSGLFNRRSPFMLGLNQIHGQPPAGRQSPFLRTISGEEAWPHLLARQAGNAASRQDLGPWQGAPAIEQPEYTLPSNYTRFETPIFRPFANSDASELQKEWSKHLLDKHNYKDFCGPLDISTPPKPQLDFWVFKKHKDLPAELECVVGMKITQADMLLHELADKLTAALAKPDLYDTHKGALTPEFEHDAKSDPEQHYIDHLKDTLSKINDKLNNELGNEVRDASGNRRNYYTNNLGDRAHGYTFGYLFINTHPRDTEQFKELMQAIEQNDEPKFVQQIIRLSTTFDHKHTVAKDGFIDVMTHLFVTKKFPSQGIKATYLHFLLRCGQIY